ncbi:MAG: hypothetical protein GWN87_31360 [Desulfuromonadales bacterium]|nr:hypothetical protein [Desulfuromonadales bacterium]NIS44040.1 hypothetical protein [Desulfuromonadales bacterium]
MTGNKRIFLLLLLIVSLSAGGVPAADKNYRDDEPGDVSERQKEQEKGKLSREELEIIKMMDLLEMMDMLQEMDAIIFLEKES